MPIYVRWALVLITIALKVSGFPFKRRKFLMDQEHGLPVHEEVRKLKNKSNLTILSTQLLRPMFFKLTHETPYMRLCKRLGLAPEPITLNPEFDEAFYVASDHPRFLNALRGNPDLQRNLLELKSLGCTEILGDDGGLLTLRNTRAWDAPSMPDLGFRLRSRLALIKAALEAEVEGDPRTKMGTDPFQKRIGLFDRFVFGASVYGVLGLIAFELDHRISLLDPWSLIPAAGRITALILGFSFIGIAPLLKSSARAPWILSKFLLFSLLGGFAVGIMLASDLNQVLDSSPTEITRAWVANKYKHTTGGSKGSQTTYYVELVYPEGAPALPRRLSISVWDYFEITVKQGLELHVRQGFLNAPYISKLAPVPAPQGMQDATRGAAQPISDQQARTLSEWRAEPLPAFGTGQDGWEEVRYASGGFRERVPLVQGKKHGRARYWHENGRLYGEIPWVNNEKHGCFKLYRPDGTLENDLNYREGKPHGILTWYDAQGKPTQRVLYDRGTPLNNDPRYLESLKHDASQRTPGNCD